MFFNRAKLFRLNENHIKRIHYKGKLVNRSIDRQLSANERKKIMERILKSTKNKKHNEIDDLFIKKHWSIDHYKNINLPIVVGKVDKKRFSQRDEKYLWVMDLPI